MTEFPATMLAAQVHEWGAPPVLAEVPVPRPGPDEVLVRVQAAGLSHLDLTIASGTFELRPQLPYIGGIEGSGVVCAGGDLEPGTQVVLRGGGIGSLRGGTWAEYVCAPRRAVTPLPHPLRPSVAATFFQPTSTAYVALHDVGRVGPEDRVAVIGAAGAVGGQLVQQASRLGAQVVGFVGRPEQLAGVPGSGERHLLDEQTDGRLAAERPFTVLVDTLGGSELADRLRWIEPGGRAVVIGYVVGTSTTLDLPNWLFSDVALLPVNMIRAEPRAREISSTLVEMLHRGDLVLDVQEFGPDDIAAGLDALRQGLVKGRAAVRFAEDVGAAAGSGAPLGAGEASRP